jgi:nitroreductase
MNKMYDIIVSRRTVRQFQAESVPRLVLERIVEAGRLAPSAANLQPLEFILADEDAVRRDVFPCLKWAAYIAPAGNPAPGREPTAYVIVLANSEVREKGYEYDVGAAMENMILAGLTEGVASCWLLSVDRDKIREIFAVPVTHKIDSVLALGYPAEEPKVEEIKDSCRYWKEADGTFHVPKRRLKDVIHFGKF